MSAASWSAICSFSSICSARDLNLVPDSRMPRRRQGVQKVQQIQKCICTTTIAYLLAWCSRHQSTDATIDRFTDTSCDDETADFTFMSRTLAVMPCFVLLIDACRNSFNWELVITLIHVFSINANFFLFVAFAFVVIQIVLIYIWKLLYINCYILIKRVAALSSYTIYNICNCL